MRVVVVPSWFPHPHRPLSGIFFDEQTRLLARDQPGVEVHVLVPDERSIELSWRLPLGTLRGLAGYLRDREVVRESDENGRAVSRFRTLRWSDRLANGSIAHTCHRFAREVSRIISHRGPVDVIHAHVSAPGGEIASWLSRRFKIPYVLSEHMSPFPFSDIPVDAVGNFLPRLQKAFYDAAVVTGVSRAHAADIEARVHRPVEVMPNFVDERRFKSDISTPRTEIRRFISVGHLAHQKGFDVLIAAFARLRSLGNSAKLEIVGEGGERAVLERMISDLRLEDTVTLSGAVANADLALRYASADAFVLASRHESFGVVVIEALASGLPCVVTRCGGPEEFVNEGRGLVVQPGDAVGLSEAMRSVAVRSWSRDAIRQYFSASFSSAAVTTRLVELYERVRTG